MTFALHVEGLAVSYGDHQALHPLDLDVLPGELIGIIGPNGAGKTSFIRALCGKLKIKGSIKIDGNDIGKRQNRQRLLGLVPQDIGLYPHMSARENLECFAKIMGLPRNGRAQIIDKALESVDMKSNENIRVSSLSGGMKRRINVAAAIMHNPKLIIFDEPTAGVDIPARDTVHRLARRLAEKGMAVLLVTHELEQAEALCDKVLILCHGKKLAYDHPAKILERSFTGMREVMVRYATQPTEDCLQSMKPFEFSQGELPTIWTAMTQASEVSFVSAFMTSVRNGDQLIREISVRRPGLTSLMHRIEKTGALL